MVQKKAGTGVKNKALYKRLRNLGGVPLEPWRLCNTDLVSAPGSPVVL